MERKARPKVWRPTFCESAMECRTLATELRNLAQHLEPEAPAGSLNAARVESLRDWAKELDQRPANGLVT
jgi:hypothetical protein